MRQFGTDTLILATFCCFAAFAPNVAAQGSAPAATASRQIDPAKAADVLISTADKDFVLLIEAMPEDKFDFAPSGGEFKGVRTFGEQMKHAAAVIYMVAASVLAGEMILTFYKPAKLAKKRKPLDMAVAGDSETILSEVFDTCLNNGTNSFTSEALFNRLVIELWHRRALSCLNLNREKFASQLEERGWKYNTRNHLWSRVGYPKKHFADMMLFDREND